MNYNVQIMQGTGGESKQIYPKTVAKNVGVTPVNNIPTDDTTLDKVLDDLSDLAFTNSSSVVKTSGNESVSGKKDFTDGIITNDLKITEVTSGEDKTVTFSLL